MKALREFAARTLSDDLLLVEPTSADASFRSYWRVTSQDPAKSGSHIVMDAPPGKEDLRPWLDVARRLRKANLNAPEILVEDIGDGFVLMSDLGSRIYRCELNEGSADALYRDALDALLGMQTRVETAGLPVYDESRLVAELELFPEWFLKHHLGVVTSRADRQLIEGTFEILVKSALEQPQGFVHRDYHSRNLMIVEGQNPGILDFQDAVVGPITYDLVSLLRDCYIEWPAGRVSAWANAHRDRLVDKGVLKYGELRWKRWFDLMGLQRHLKVLGIFSRLYYRDSKPAYLGDLPLVLKYTLEVANRYKDFAEFAQWLQQKTQGVELTQPDIAG